MTVGPVRKLRFYKKPIEVVFERGLQSRVVTCDCASIVKMTIFTIEDLFFKEVKKPNIIRNIFNIKNILQ